MPYTALKPGPSPASCRTCRKRRKKCDKSKPHCDRCLKGGYECLGYENGKPHSRINQNSFNANKEISETLDPSLNACYVGRPSILGAALRYRINSPNLSTNAGLAKDLSEEFDRLWPQDQSQSICMRRPFNIASRGRATRHDTTTRVRTVCQSIPRSIGTTQITRKVHLARFAREYVFQSLGVWLSIPSPAIGDYVVSQMRGDRTMQAMHLGSSVIQALNQDAWAQYHGPKRYFNWINQFEQCLATDFADGPSFTDVRDNLTAHLELVMLKLAVVDSTSAYILLRDALPKFLLLVSTESDLLIERPNGSLTISFPRTLNSPRHELVRFVTYDSLMGLLLGAPPLVEYVYEGACGVDQCERVHGIPTACFQILSQVNSSRTGSSACLENWRVLEQRVLEWGSPHVISAAPAPEAANIEQATIKEIWRHLLLIYIYMGMGGASSHDSRVQASVDHIFHHAETLGTSRIGIHMLPHCIAAGVAARLERHRVAIYRKLMSFTDARPWFSCGPQFSQFLYHLWHGAGDGGRAVTWDDYIQARQQVIPI